MDQIQDHQELLDRFIAAEISTIMDRSSDISDDMKDLAIVVNKYANEHGLIVNWDHFQGYDISFLEG